MKRIQVLLLLLLLSGTAAAVEPFTISDIRVEGLQRISADTVFAALPVNVGDRVNADLLAMAARSLFRSGNFDDIKIGRDGEVLVVIVQERPSISEINIDGNKAIKTEDLKDGLEQAGLSEGQVFKRSTLEGMRMELTRQYVSQGRYDASIETDVVAQPRNRVSVSIHIDEGNTASIKHINIVGNEVFSDDELLSEFELQPTGWFSWITSNDKYAREKLKGDLEKLNSYYMDRGYIQFNIDSTQVAISPEKDKVYITANISEGDQYTIGSVELSGDLVLPEEELQRYVLIKEGQVFSQALVTYTENVLTKRLGNEGYNFAEVSGLPQLNEEEKSVDLKLFIDPGKRTYVRRIEFRGNNRTADEVLRREMRQMEVAPASADKIELSRVRLERLGYFKQAEVETIEVPGSDDLIDLEYTVEEQSSGSLAASIGFSQDSGLIVGANIQQNNFLGTGKTIGIGVSRSDFLTNVSFSYTEPYFTEDGVARGFSVFYRKANLDEVNVASYTTNTAGASLNFSYPISETQRLGFSFGYANTEIDAGLGAVQEIVSSPRLIEGFDQYFENTLDLTTTPPTADGPLTHISQLPPSAFAQLDETGFLDRYGDEFDNFSTTISWRQSTLNRGILATRGGSQGVSLEVALPGSDTEYYKLNYNGQIYVPLPKNFTLRFRTELGYGDGYGNIEELPFFENFFGGGFSSVRGYESNTLGPRSTPADIYRLGRPVTGFDSNGNPIFANRLGYVRDPVTGELRVDDLGTRTQPFGGNILVEGSIELLVPLPFLKDQRSVRSGFFLDGGNIFSSSCRETQLNCSDVDLNELRYSAGFGLTWITGFGPLTFSLAKPLNDESIDEPEVFQFSLGRTF